MNNYVVYNNIILWLQENGYEVTYENVNAVYRGILLTSIVIVALIVVLIMVTVVIVRKISRYRGKKFLEKMDKLQKANEEARRNKENQ